MTLFSHFSRTYAYKFALIFYSISVITFNNYKDNKLQIVMINRQNDATAFVDLFPII